MSQLTKKNMFSKYSSLLKDKITIKSQFDTFCHYAQMYCKQVNEGIFGKCSESWDLNTEKHNSCFILVVVWYFSVACLGWFIFLLRGNLESLLWTWRKPSQVTSACWPGYLASCNFGQCVDGMALGNYLPSNGIINGYWWFQCTGGYTTVSMTTVHCIF